MQNKTIEPLVSLVIVGAVFCLSLFLILQEGEALNRQLRATVFQPQEEEKEVGQLTARAVQQMKGVFASACLKDAYNTFETLWNQECENLGLEERCDLPKAVAEPLLDDYQESEDKCY